MKAASLSASVTQRATLGAFALMTSALGITGAGSAAYERYVPSEKGLAPGAGIPLPQVVAVMSYTQSTLTARWIERILGALIG